MASFPRLLLKTALSFTVGFKFCIGKRPIISWVLGESVPPLSRILAMAGLVDPDWIFLKPDF
jgi:hypothetical protein